MYDFEQLTQQIIRHQQIAPSLAEQLDHFLWSKGELNEQQQESLAMVIAMYEAGEIILVE